MKAAPFPSLFPLSLFLFVSVALGAEIRDWTDNTGRQIKAEFVKGDAENLTIRMAGKEYVVKLSYLSAESQALARKLIAEAAKPLEPNPFAPATPSPPTPPVPTPPKPVPEPAPVDPKPEPEPEPVDAGPPVIAPPGKILLPTFGKGKWAKFHSYKETATCDVALHGSGKLCMYLKGRDSEGYLLDGRPLVIQFDTGCYSKPHPRGWVVAYSHTRTDFNYRFRKITGFKSPPEPSENLSHLNLTAELEDGAQLKIGAEFSIRGLAVWGEAVDASRSRQYHKTVIGLRLTMPDAIKVKDGDGLAEWKPIVGDTKLQVVTATRARETLPYLEKWDDLKKKYTYHKGIQNATVSGKLFGARKFSIGPKSLRNAHFYVGSYSGVFPFRHYYFTLRDQQGGKIDKFRRLEIAVK